MKETTSHLVIETLETHVELCKQAKKKKKSALTWYCYPKNRMQAADCNPIHYINIMHIYIHI